MTTEKQVNVIEVGNRLIASWTKQAEEHALALQLLTVKAEAVQEFVTELRKEMASVEEGTGSGSNPTSSEEKAEEAAGESTEAVSHN